MGGEEGSRSGRERHGLTKLKAIRWNLGPAALYEEAIRRGEGVVTAGGALLVTTGEHTGRAPKDKFIVDDATTHGSVDWGNVNQPISRAKFDAMHARVAAYYQGRDAFVLDCWAGRSAEPRGGKRVGRTCRARWGPIN